MSEEWDHWLEKKERRDSKNERKLLKKHDRSQYKKTDRPKFEKSDDLHENIKGKKEDYIRGRIVAILSQGVEVNVDGKIYQCQLRGLLKRDTSQDKNLIVVGDFVYFETTQGTEGVIHHVEARKSFLSRADNLSRRKQQLIAANIDQVLITVSVGLPALKPFLVDRYIIAARKGNMEPVVVINKIDLLDQYPAEKELEQVFVDGLKKANIKVFEVSGESGLGLDALRDEMKDKASVFAGQSGVGKTSLINKILNLDLRVGPATEKTQKGAHTTTLARLISIPTGGLCIDTPGIRSFGIWNMTREEIRSYFPDIDQFKDKCRFPDCTHTQESGCAVIKAVEEDVLSPLRYESYIYLINSLDDKHARR